MFGFLGLELDQLLRGGHMCSVSMPLMSDYLHVFFFLGPFHVLEAECSGDCIRRQKGNHYGPSLEPWTLPGCF